MKKWLFTFLVLFSIFDIAYAKMTSPATEHTSAVAAIEPQIEVRTDIHSVMQPTPSILPTPTPEEAEDHGIIPALSQLPELPNGCEAVAATMLLNWAGLPITKEEMADKLPRGPMPYENEDGAFIGGNPKDVFVGDPYQAGYGIYHKPMAKLMDGLLPGQVKDISESSFENLLSVVAGGNPAMVWATEHMDAPYLDLEWQDEEGELVEWYQPEHALLLTSWDADFAYMNDPMTGGQESYALADFKYAWERMGSQAIIINKKA
ncbi:C39 family peptidase [Paenibacillus sp. HWE-109]|uniref:C39 family peptidase n=1 Tax=Paenibacillus sp. HWE-109 TaxID=1306526 RepID=UPI001EDD0DF3|nr:C39 family peptidase [Paenibacillus sp. HWE-109]UKS25210.1 C39 family peptidase [Paenibacillus sp. HWE-109]